MLGDSGVTTEERDDFTECANNHPGCDVLVRTRLSDGRVMIESLDVVCEDSPIG